MSRLRTRFAGLLALAGAVYVGFVMASSPGRSLAAAPRVPASPAVAALADLSNAFATVAERVKPSVVYITSKRLVTNETAGVEVPPEFRRFFGLPSDPAPGRSQRPPALAAASGSGFIVSADGYILTNDHVVDGATHVRVRLLDRREFEAKVVGTDPATDIAVLKIAALNLVPAALGSSQATRVGQWVLAVGNPFGENLSFTVTQGIISAKGRALDLPNRSSRSIQDFLQTDAAINPGNSGGPLVDTQGEVVGINSAIASETGTYNGYGFAVPIDLARAVMKQLITKGQVDRMALGILARDATAEDAAYAGLDRIEGVLVEDVEPNSPANSAGITAGDLILAVDDTPVDHIASLQERIAFKNPGDRVTVQVARKGGKRLLLEVAVRRASLERPAADPVRATPRDSTGDEVPELGASFRPVDDRLARDLELPAEVRGLVITRQDDESPVAERLAGPSQDPDVIREVEGQPIRTVADLRRVLRAEGPGAIVTLRVWNVRARAGRIERIRLRAVR